MRKGITPVIAVVLLLMITISLVGFAFVWFGGLFRSVTASVTNQTEAKVSQMAVQVSIDDIDTTNNKVYVINTGTSTSEMTRVYVTNKTTRATKACSAPFSITPGQIYAEDCAEDENYASLGIGSGDIVKITVPGGTSDMGTG